MNRAEIEDAICDLMMQHGPDGHVDGYEKIADYVVSIRAAALEEAALLCESVGDHNPDEDLPHWKGCSDCAAAIRALKEK